MIPLTSAPTTLPSPPITTTTNARMLNWSPAVGVIVVNGAMSMPAAPAHAVPMPNVMT